MEKNYDREIGSLEARIQMMQVQISNYEDKSEQRFIRVESRIDSDLKALKQNIDEMKEIILTLKNDSKTIDSLKIDLNDLKASISTLKNDKSFVLGSWKAILIITSFFTFITGILIKFIS